MNIPEIDISVEEEKWLKTINNIEQFTLECISFVFDSLPPHDESLEISFLFTNDETIRDLNKNYRNKDKPTNVLSFPQAFQFNMDSSHRPLGDVILSYETIQKESFEQDKSFSHHAAHMLIHGILHLLGYDHEEDDDTEMMQSLEIDVLKKMGIDNPYVKMF